MDLSALWTAATAALWSRVLLHLALAAVVALVATTVLSRTVRALGRRRGWPAAALTRLRRPLRWLALVVAAGIAVTTALVGADVGEDARTTLTRAFTLAVIAVTAWFVSAALASLVDLLLLRYRTDVADNRLARRVRTQALILRRVGVAAVVVVALAAGLLTFPAAQAAGASLLASAGVLSVIAGLAAQSTLGNVIAGMQLAFSGAIRVDDVVVADGEWGRIEEITLTSVVVHVWDDRRLVLPSTYFTTTPFENWTRTSSALMQSVDFDLDWRVDTDALRAELDRVLAGTTLWDGRVAVLQVTDAVGGLVHVRALLTAVDAPTLFDLRCLVREALVGYLHREQPDALPRSRVALAGTAEPDARPAAGDRMLLAVGHAAE